MQELTCCSLHSQCAEDGKICGRKFKNIKYDSDDIRTVAQRYNIQFNQVRSEINVEGSPERTNFRTVFEDVTKNLFIIEVLPEKTLETKKSIALSLEYLNNKGLQEAQPYSKNTNGEFITQHNHALWQIIPYIKSVDLKRPEYTYDPWRGIAFADFYSQFQQASQNIPFFKKEDSFSIKDYIYTLLSTIKKNKPDILKKISPVISFLEKKYLPLADTFPVTFCHGDYHPLNILWGENDIKAVIDWEFSGYKSEIYDIANMIGCVGMEDPNSLTGELIIKFISNLKSSAMIQNISWEYLLESVIAGRFAWMSEWLRKNDTQMQTMEEEYMNILINKYDILKDTWGSLKASHKPLIYI